MRKKPRAERVFKSSNKTVWLVKWPSTSFKWGKSYYATTYPNSDHVFMETAATKRPVSNLVGSKILPQIKDAIARAMLTTE